MRIDYDCPICRELKFDTPVVSRAFCAAIEAIGMGRISKQC